MATQGNKKVSKGIPTIKDAFVVLIKTEWNSSLVNKLEAGAKKFYKKTTYALKLLLCLEPLKFLLL